MGNGESKDTQDSEEIGEFLDDHPEFLSTYIDRHPYLLDNYVEQNIDEWKVKEWLKKVESPAPAEILQTLRIDYLKEKNGLLQHTNSYVNNNLVVRRADKFNLEILFKNRAFLKAKDSICLEFAIGPNPKVVSGTKIRVPIKDSLQGSKWTAMLGNVNEKKKKVAVEVNIPATAIVGKYQLTVEIVTITKDGPKVERKVKEDIIVIFNPFQPADDVYMEDQKERNEYVLNHEGIIYQGSSRSIRGKHWDFAQFEEGILDIVLKLLRQDSRAKKEPIKAYKKRNSPVYVSRVLSAMVNCNDDTGVLYGRWDGEYSDGKGPSFWNGSADILRLWNQKKMDPVKYGQCWVFSGLLTTALRALGIPARSVTNFASAHDTEYNMTIDSFIDEEGEEYNKGIGDSVWNFHVWNGCYFRRSDLPKGYDGWQAVDATPQEFSGDIFQCGPAPLKAIKNGEIFIGYDTNFVFSEVNADRCIWKVDENGDVVELVKRYYSYVGKNISTKAVGSNERHDITNEYKYPEGSEEERSAFQLAYAHGKKADYHDELVVKGEGDIEITIAAVGKTVVGEKLTIQVKITNTTAKACKALINTAVFTVLHNDERKAILRKLKATVSLKPKQAEVQTFEFELVNYLGKLVDNNVIRTATSVKNLDDNIMYFDSSDVTMEVPEGMLTVKCGDSSPAWENFEVRFEVHNKFPFRLTGGEFTITGSGVNPKTLKNHEIIEPNATYLSPPIDIKGYLRGNKRLTADFDSNEVNNIKGTKVVEIY